MRGARPLLLRDPWMATWVAYGMKQAIKTTKAFAKVLGVTLHGKTRNSFGQRVIVTS